MFVTTAPDPMPVASAGTWIDSRPYIPTCGHTRYTYTIHTIKQYTQRELNYKILKKHITQDWGDGSVDKVLAIYV